MQSLSSPQFFTAGSFTGQPFGTENTPKNVAPLSAQTMTSAGQQTAWKTSSMGEKAQGGYPHPFSWGKQTGSSFFKWGDEEAPGSNLPQSDPGANYLMSREG